MHVGGVELELGHVNVSRGKAGEPAGEKRPQGMRHAHGRRAMRKPSSFIRTVTVGSGIGPDLLTLRCTGGARGLVRAALAAFAPTAGGELHPALKTLRVVVPANRPRILPPASRAPAWRKLERCVGRAQARPVEIAATPAAGLGLPYGFLRRCRNSGH
jgi:hypothetical protein